MITTYSYVSRGYDLPQTKGTLFTEKDVDLFKDPTRSARMVKLLSHLFIKDEWSLWTDADIQLLMSPEEILEKYKDRGDVITFKHRARNCVYDEAIAVALGKRDTNQEIINEQMNFYRSEGYPEKNGLFETGCILRHHIPEVIRFNEFWWAQDCRFSKRDQLSVNYSAWKLNMKIGLFEGNYNASEILTIRGHQPNRNLV
jgi:Protein of unknown function (DUF616)